MNVEIYERVKERERKREIEKEKKDKARLCFSNSGGLNRALGFNGKRTFLLPEFEVPGNSINGYSVCPGLLAAV